MLHVISHPCKHTGEVISGHPVVELFFFHKNSNRIKLFHFVYEHFCINQTCPIQGICPQYMINLLCTFRLTLIARVTLQPIVERWQFFLYRRLWKRYMMYVLNKPYLVSRPSVYLSKSAYRPVLTLNKFSVEHWRLSADILRSGIKPQISVDQRQL